ncbi:MAG TPA: co-chaperone DjlA [Steroidobacteraceae bacterium]|nr:co-chaperone DjlA [Steroidobacteraceae bacterium]
MKWLGKALGAALGYVAFGPVGSLLGVVLGHQFDRDIDFALAGPARARLYEISTVFFRTTFYVMGHLAKSDGRVTESEIQAARLVMQQLRLSPSEVQFAIECFTRGKEQGFPLERALAELRDACEGRPDLVRFFVEIEMRAALYGNGMQGPVRQRLAGIAQRVGISGLELAHMEAIIRAYGRQQQSSAPPPAERLADAYEVLEVAREAADAEVTKAYRRQMSRNHPDKLKANGLPESMLEMAKEKTQQIQQAYESIKEARGMR